MYRPGENSVGLPQLYRMLMLRPGENSVGLPQLYRMLMLRPGEDLSRFTPVITDVDVETR